MQTILYLKAHWHIIVGILIVVALAVWAYIDWQFVQLSLKGPRDTVGNGITIGRAKAFDNRSLSLRIERLSNSLEKLRVVDQKATDNIGKPQGQTSTLSAQTLTLDARAGVKPAAAGAPEKAATPPAADASGKTPAAAGDNKPDTKPDVALAAGDILNEQLNLASQIMNLQTLYERSLSDRLIRQEARLQTVLGFQVSINPPKGFENCVAIVEVAVRLKPDPAVQMPPDGVSLVAMIPQEKTYNAQTISTNSQSIGGSAVASVVTVGFSSKGESRQLFVHRDSDTVAFERNPVEEPRLFPGENATVFGWEFRPVLGRETVSPGMRQMLAVIALPRPDVSEYAEDVVLEIKTRSYWRRYERKTQTSSPKWHWFPQRIDGSNTVESQIQELSIPNTAQTQAGLAPKVATISWVNSADDSATVIVKGENFFPGTRVLLGGRVLKEDDGSLTLKSDQALEFETSLTSIATGNAVLSGRFGRSCQLSAPTVPGVKYIYITRAAIKQSRRGKDLRLQIDIKGIDENGDDVDLNVGDFHDLPEPILFVGGAPIPLPYDYWPIEPHPPEPPDPSSQTATTSRGTVSKSGDFLFAKDSEKKSVRVEAWIPSRIAVNRTSSVMFRVPFCGLEYQTATPVQFFEPTVTRLGGDDLNSVFRISHSLWHERKVTVELDQIYDVPPTLQKVSKDEGDYRFTISNDILARYRNLVLRIAGAEPYVIAIPEDKPKPKPFLDLNAKPPEVVKGTIGPAEWSGTDLGLITGVTLLTPANTQSSGATSPAPKTRTQADFTVYNDGKKISVYFSDTSTGVIGKAEVEFQINSNAADTVRVPILITKPTFPTV